MRSREKIIEDKKRLRCLTATGRGLKSPPSKVRIRARTLIGLPVNLAIAKLRFSPNVGAKHLLGVLKSAVSNASDGAKMDVDEMVVASVRVDKGATLKRHHPVSHGMAKAILKRFCQIRIEVAEAGPAKGRKGRKVAAPAAKPAKTVKKAKKAAETTKKTPAEKAAKR
jgi:large subunit ribosomal protein L22